MVGPRDGALLQRDKERGGDAQDDARNLENVLLPEESETRGDLLCDLIHVKCPEHPQRRGEERLPGAAVTGTPFSWGQLQYFGHLMLRATSLEKTLMQGDQTS